MDIIRLERAKVNFTSSIAVDGYRMPNGEFRVSLAGASVVLGFEKNWISRVTSRGGKTLKALQGMGFTGYQLEGKIDREPSHIRGASNVSTISLDDFKILIIYAAQQDKPEAIALNAALIKTALTDFFKGAFGETPLTIDQKREMMSTSYAQTLNWILEDRRDIESLSLVGDPEEINNWNRAINWLQ